MIQCRCDLSVILVFYCRHKSTESILTHMLRATSIQREHRRRQNNEKWDGLGHGERVARAYNRDLRADPRAGSMGRALGGASKNTPEAEKF